MCCRDDEDYSYGDDINYEEMEEEEDDDEPAEEETTAQSSEDKDGAKSGKAAVEKADEPVPQSSVPASDAKDARLPNRRQRLQEIRRRSPRRRRRRRALTWNKDSRACCKPFLSREKHFQTVHSAWLGFVFLF